MHICILPYKLLTYGLICWLIGWAPEKTSGEAFGLELSVIQREPPTALTRNCKPSTQPPHPQARIWSSSAGYCWRQAGSERNTMTFSYAAPHLVPFKGWANFTPVGRNYAVTDVNRLMADCYFRWWECTHWLMLSVMYVSILEMWDQMSPISSCCHGDSFWEIGIYFFFLNQSHCCLQLRWLVICGPLFPLRGKSWLHNPAIFPVHYSLRTGNTLSPVALQTNGTSRKRKSFDCLNPVQRQGYLMAPLFQAEEVQCHSSPHSGEAFAWGQWLFLASVGGSQHDCILIQLFLKGLNSRHAWAKVRKCLNARHAWNYE